MSHRASSYVWEHSPHRGSALVVLLALADFADAAGHSYPSIETLAKKARILPRNCQAILQELRSTGEIKVTLQAGRGHVNRYQVVIPENWRPPSAAPIGSDLSATVESESTATRPDEDEKVQTSTPFVSPEKVQIPVEKVHSSVEKVHSSVEKVHSSVVKGAALCTQNRHEPLEESSEGTVRERAPGGAAPAPTADRPESSMALVRVYLEHSRQTLKDLDVRRQRTKQFAAAAALLALSEPATEAEVRRYFEEVDFPRADLATCLKQLPGYRREWSNDLAPLRTGGHGHRKATAADNGREFLEIRRRQREDRSGSSGRAPTSGKSLLSQSTGT